jgi:hypothetical protein
MLEWCLKKLKKFKMELSPGIAAGDVGPKDKIRSWHTFEQKLMLRERLLVERIAF